MSRVISKIDLLVTARDSKSLCPRLRKGGDNTEYFRFCIVGGEFVDCITDNRSNVERHLYLYR
jgi:hypothetical protein